MKYIIGLWPGLGYDLENFNVEAENEYDAIEALVLELVNENKTNYFMTESEMSAARIAGDVYVLNDDYDEIEGWIYWDATMSGASAPVWLRVDNMKIITV